MHSCSWGENGWYKVINPPPLIPNFGSKPEWRGVVVNADDDCVDEDGDGDLVLLVTNEVQLRFRAQKNICSICIPLKWCTCVFRVEMEDSWDMIRVDVSAVDEDGDVDIVLHVTDEWGDQR